jgi:hypothetical protein
MAEAFKVMVAMQSVPRSGQGNATANQITEQTQHDQTTHATAMRGDARISILWAIRLHGLAESRVTGIFGDIARDEITRDIGVGQFEKLHEGSALVACAESESIS